VSSPFLGEIRLFPYNFAPRGWAFCSGQIVPISQNQALFALLGTTYGGDGQTTFALPDLRGRLAVSSGQGPGLSDYTLGQSGGEEAVTLNVNEIPSHNHGVLVNGAGSISASARNRYPGKASAGTVYANLNNGVQMNPATITPTGGNQPHDNVQPYLTLNYCIAMEGIFPSRN
jgi:microcystin-dependent protein